MIQQNYDLTGCDSQSGDNMIQQNYDLTGCESQTGDNMIQQNYDLIDKSIKGLRRNDLHTRRCQKITSSHFLDDAKKPTTNQKFWCKFRWYL